IRMPRGDGVANLANLAADRGGAGVLFERRGRGRELGLALANLLESRLGARRIRLRGGDDGLPQGGLQVGDAIADGARLLDAERGAAGELLDLRVHPADAVEAIAAENQHGGGKAAEAYNEPPTDGPFHDYAPTLLACWRPATSCRQPQLDRRSSHTVREV